MTHDDLMPQPVQSTDEVRCVCGATWERHGNCNYEMVYSPDAAHIAQPVQQAEILCDAERQSWELHLEQAAAIRELLDLHAPKTEGNLQTRLAQVFAQPVQSGNMALRDVFRDGCKACVREKQSRSDNKEWQEGVKRGKEIVSLMAIRAINDKKVKLCPQD